MHAKISSAFFAPIGSDLKARIMGCFLKKHDSLLHLFLLACMLTVALGVPSVAPDDFVSSCTAFAEPGSFNNSKQKVLLDTQFYPSSDILTVLGDDGLWISLDFDMTTGDSFGKVRKRESEQESSRESVNACVHCILVHIRCSGLIRARV